MLPKTCLTQSLWHNGPTPGNLYNFPAKSNTSGYANEIDNFGTQRSSQPITTGTSVIGVKFDEGIVIAADNLVSYGSLARFNEVQRVFTVNNKSIIGVGGDYADFQFLKKYIDQKVTDDICFDDDINLKPKSLYNWLTRIMYTRRSRMTPLWLDVVVGGIENNEPFLGHVDMRGRSYQDNTIATGLGRHIAIPILRKYCANKNPNKDKAIEIAKNCMEVLYYRDCRASPNYTLGICTKEGTSIDNTQQSAQNWQVAPLTWNS